MTSLFAISFFLLTQLTVEQGLTEKYCPPENEVKPSCPRGGSYHTIKNVSVHNGMPKNQSQDCGRQFVIHPTKKNVSDETKELIDKLLLEQISLRGIKRVMGISWPWLQNYVHNKFSFDIGERSRQSAQKRWESVSPVYRQCTVVYTDFWVSCQNIIPSKGT